MPRRILKNHGFSSRPHTYAYAVQDKKLNTEVVNTIREILRKVAQGDDLDDTCIFALVKFRRFVEEDSGINDTDSREAFWEHFPPNWYGRWIAYYKRLQTMGG